MKKLIWGLLAVVLLLSAVVPALAQESFQELDNSGKIKILQNEGLVEGYEDGSLGLDKTINRQEITKILVYAVGEKELADQMQGASEPFPDVEISSWANGVIAVAKTQSSKKNNFQMINGYEDGTFQPTRDVTIAELSKMLVVMADPELDQEAYDQYSAKWPYGWVVRAAEIGIYNGMNNAEFKVEEPATRGQAFEMLYNALYDFGSIDIEGDTEESTATVKEIDKTDEKPIKSILDVVDEIFEGRDN